MLFWRPLNHLANTSVQHLLLILVCPCHRQMHGGVLLRSTNCTGACASWVVLRQACGYCLEEEKPRGP